MNGFLGVIRLNDRHIFGNLDENSALKEYRCDEYFFKIFNSGSEENLTFFNISKSDEISICGYLRIDNRKELAKSLVINTDEDDKSILLKAYKKWGSQLSNKIIGSFAFVIYDLRKNKFLCFRDHMGMKPFYYFKNNEVFIFSSKISLMLDTEYIKKTLNKERVIDYLMYVHPKDGQTFYNEIHKLPRSHILEYKENKFKLNKYFDFHIKPKSKFISEKENVNEFKRILYEVIDAQVNSGDGDIGLAYSGGLDSSSLLKISDSMVDNKSIHTKSAVFVNLGNSEREIIDEKYFMDLGLKDNINTNHEFIKFDNEGPIMNIDSSLEMFDEPISAINFYIFKKIAASLKMNDVEILLDGIDGDSVISHGNEIFGSYAKKFNFIKLYNEAVKFADFNKINKPSFMRLFKRYIIINNLPENIFWRFFDKTQLHSYWALKILNKNDRNIKKINLLSSLKNHYGRFPFRQNPDPYIEHKRIITDGSWENSLEDLESVLNHYGIDHRMPFFDRRLMEFCLSVPVSLKIKNGINRYIFRKAMKNIVPKEIRLRSSKSDLSPPLVNEVMSLGESNIINYVLDKNNPISKLISKKEFKKFIKDTFDGKSYKNSYFLIFQLYSLSKWMKKEGLKW